MCLMCIAFACVRSEAQLCHTSACRSPLLPQGVHVSACRWEVCVSTTDGQFQQVSFVNSICTYKGGTHVNYLVDQVTK